MEILKFEDECDLYSYMCRLVDDKRNVTAVLHYEEAVELMRCFLEDFDVEVGHLEIGDSDYNGYDKEYYVSIDTDRILDVCPVMPHYDVEFGYVPIQEADVILYRGDVKQAIVEVNDPKTSFQIEYVDEDDTFIDGILSGCTDKCPLYNEAVLRLLAKLLQS